jgi:hypothetical protein
MPFLKKVALIEDLADNEFVHRYVFTREYGAEGALELRPAEAGKWEYFRDRLKNRNAHPSLLNRTIIGSAAASEPQERLAYAPATGWRTGHKTFVLPRRVVGANTKKICGLPPDKHRPWPQPRGTSKNWLRSVGSIATKSSGMMLTTCCSFASPLLRIANEQSFGICLAGKTGGGKTTATLVAWSTLAGGQIDQLPSWNATIAGLEPVLRSHNDCLLVVDDLNKMPVASDKEKHHCARNFAHNLGTGSTKLRSPAFDDDPDNGEQYRVISLTSAETTIAELAAKCGEQRGGDARRLIDVPIYFDGLDHIFDRVPKADQLSQSGLQSLYSSIHIACVENHGVIFAKYIKFLIKSGANLQGRITRYVEQFCTHLTDNALGIVHADIIRKFGLIYAGGALAIEGIGLPWKRLELLQAIAKCCRVALGALTSEERIRDEGMGLLKQRLMALPMRPTIKREAWNLIDGFVEQHADRFRCIIKTDKFNRIFVNSLQRGLVLDELIRRRRITRSRSQENQVQFVWPDGTRRRSIEINWGRVATGG